MEFVEIIDDRVIIAGFKYSQFFNAHTEAVNGIQCITIPYVSSDGHNIKNLDQFSIQVTPGLVFEDLKLSNAQLMKLKSLLEKQSSEELVGLKERLLNYHFNQKERANQDRQFEIKRFDKGPYHLFMVLNESHKAK